MNKYTKRMNRTFAWCSLLDFQVPYGITSPVEFPIFYADIAKIRFICVLLIMEK